MHHFMKNSLLAIGLFSLAFLTSCVVIDQGTVGMRQKFGKFSPNVLPAGLHWYNPFTSSIMRVPVRTVNIEMRLDLPSKEGLTIASSISILYHIEQAKVPFIMEEIGVRYEDVVITSVFRSAAADVCARFFAKDLHSGERSKIEDEIKGRMMELLGDRGFVIEAVLMKDIKLPAGLSQAIEAKLQAEQRAQQMQFVLDQQRLEADRLRIEATGKAEAQQILSGGLTPEILQLRQIEAMLELAKSPNTKLIFTGDKGPSIMAPLNME